MKASMMLLGVFLLILISPYTSAFANHAYVSQDDGEKSEDLKIYSKYDFVAGDKIIFEDDQAGEQVGEFPSRWD